MQPLQLTLGTGIGALEAALRLPKPVEKRYLDFGGAFLQGDAFFCQLDTGQLPLRDGHLLEVELLSPRLGLPFGFQIVAKLLKFLEVFAGQHDGAGAEAVTEAVEPDSRFPLGSLGAGGL